MLLFEVDYDDDGPGELTDICRFTVAAGNWCNHMRGRSISNVR